MPDKDYIRKEAGEERKSLSSEELKIFNEKILQYFLQLNISKFNSVHSYLPIALNNEIDTLKIIGLIHQSFPQIKVIISDTDFKNCSMEKMYVLEKGFERYLQTGKWGIPTVNSALSLYKGEVDAVIIPLLAFDTKGNRVGYGKGFYDRFLAALNPSPFKIGFCHTSKTYDIDNLNVYDQALDICITPEGIYTF